MKKMKQTSELPIGGTNKMSKNPGGIREVEGRGPGADPKAPKAEIQRTKVPLSSLHSQGSAGKR